MRDNQYLLEIGIHSIIRENLKGESGNVSFWENVENAVKKAFPSSPCSYCDAIYEERYPGWTIGIVDECSNQIRQLAESFPNIVFAIKQVDNYGISLDAYSKDRVWDLL